MEKGDHLEEAGLYCSLPAEGDAADSIKVSKKKTAFNVSFPDSTICHASLVFSLSTRCDSVVNPASVHLRNV